MLASASPRRRELLATLGVPFSIVPSQVEETPLAPGEDLGALAERLALSKALSIQQAVGQASSPARRGQPGTAVPPGGETRKPGRIVIGADTIVYLDGKALPKPKDEAEAREMLQRLRNREHLVITGLAVVDEERQTCHVTTKVRMRAYSDEEIDAYVASGDPLDKAGAYAIQNESFHPVASIEGCYQNVVGLPLCALARMLRRVGVELPPIPESALPSECCICPE